MQELRKGCGASIGHHGELVQGVFETENGLCRALVSLHCNALKSFARFVPDAEGKLRIEPADCHKALRAAQLTLKYFDIDTATISGTISMQTNIPRGRGLGSSTADVVATIRAIADALSMDLSAEATAEIAVAAEVACDSTMFPHQSLLFGHREGRALEFFGGNLPPITVVSIDCQPDEIVETLNVPLTDYTPVEVGTFQAIKSLIKRGWREGNLRLIGLAATASARINQTRFPKPHFEEIYSLGQSKGALGIQVAHSGTVLGLLFDGRDPTVPQIVRSLVADMHNVYGLNATSFNA